MRVDWLSSKIGHGRPDSDVLDFQERQLRSLLMDAYPDRQASSELYARVAAAASQAQRSEIHSPRRRGISIGIGIVALATVCVALISFRPSWAAATVLLRAQTAMEHVTRMESTTWRLLPGGRRQLVSKSWNQNADRRIEERDGVRVFSSGRFWNYHRTTRTLTVRRQSQFAPFPSSGYSIAAIRADVSRWGWDRIEDLGGSMLDGRPVDRVAIQRPDEAARTVLLVDRATNLPDEALLQVDQAGIWTTASITEMRYPEQPLPGRLFQPDFPAAISVLNLDTAKAAWLRKISTGLSNRTVGDRQIVVRDLEVNANGVVFAVYTTGRRPGDTEPALEVDLSDSHETRFVLPQGSIAPYRSADRPGALPGGELEEQIWIPLIPESTPSPKPHTYTLTFHIPPTRHSPARKLPITLPASRTIGAEPLYMTWIEEDPNAADLVRLAAYQRAGYYLGNGNYSKAVALFQQVIDREQVQAARSGNTGRDSQTWYGMYQALAGLGREDDAYRALTEARDETVFRKDDYTWRQIEAALQGMASFRRQKALPLLRIVLERPSPARSVSTPGALPQYQLIDLGSDGRMTRYTAGTISKTRVAPRRNGNDSTVRGGSRGRTAFRPWRVNTAGAAAGSFGNHAALLIKGAIIDLGTLPGDQAAVAVVMNNRGEAAGISIGPGGIVRAFVKVDGALKAIGAGGTRTWPEAINDEGNVVGYANGAGTNHAFLWTKGRLIDLDTAAPPGWVLADAASIDDAGRIVGTGRYRGRSHRWRLDPLAH